MLTENYVQNVSAQPYYEFQKNNLILDTEIRIVNGRLKVDLHKKKLLQPIFSPILPSYHPKATATAIQYSLGLRIVIIFNRENSG